MASAQGHVRRGFAGNSKELLREARDVLTSRRGIPADLIALLGIVLFAFNRELGEKLTDWDGFSGWYALVWLLVLAVYGLFRGHHAIVSRRDDEIASQSAELNELRARPQPQVQFVGVHIDTDARLHIFRRDRLGGLSSAPVTDAMSWARVLVANDPGNRAGEKALGVVATVVFFTPDGENKLLAVDGRWAEAPQAPEVQRIGLSKEGRALDIEANADPHPLDIAMKYEGDVDCFAYNNDNGARAADARYERHRLVGPRLLVRVTLKGTNTGRVEGRFILDNPGVGLPLSIREVSDGT